MVDATTSPNAPQPSADEVRRMIVRETRLPPRLGYTALLLAGLAGAAVAATLLVTEEELPARTQIAFAVMTVIGLAWVAFAAWVLTRRRVLLMRHRVVAARMSIAFAALFTAGSVAMSRAGAAVAAWPAATAVGIVLTAVSVGTLLHARRRVSRLERRRDELERLLRAGLIAFVAAAGFTALPIEHTLHAQMTAHDEVTIEAGTFTVRGSALVVDHGRMVVPANRTSPSAATLTLRFVRFRSTAAEPGAPIVFLAGGPGDAATRVFQGIPLELLDELRAIADVIAFDQRGTGLSEPLDPVCPPATAPDSAGPAMLPRDRPAEPAHMLATLRPRVEACLADAAGRGIDVAGLTTAESADDLEALRRALDAAALALLAGSYGTHLAIAATRRHPHSIVRMALLGVEGPDDTFKLPSRVDSVIMHIAAERRGALPDEIRSLRARLAAQPARFRFPGGQVIVLGEWDLQRWIAESLDTRREIDAVLDAVPSLLDGDYAVLAQWALRYRMQRPINLMNLAMDCASYASPGRLQRIRDEAGGALLGDAIDFPLPAVCDIDDLPRLPDSFRTPLQSDVPALLVSGRFDGRTPVRNAAAVAEGLPNARTMVVDGASHDLFQQRQVMRAVVEFLRDG